MESLKNKENRTFLNYVIVQHQESAKHDKEKNSIDLSFEKQEIKPQQNISENIIVSEEENKILVNKYLAGKTEYTQKIWFIIMFQMWYKKWM